MRFIRLGVAVISAAALAGGASAQLLTGNLLLRQTVETNSGYVNQVFPDFPAFSTGMGSLVTVGGAGWAISNIQVFQVGSPTATNAWFGNVNQANLTVSRQVSGAPDPAVDPAVVGSGGNIVYSAVVGVTLDEAMTVNGVANQSFRMTANTGSITQLQSLAAGNYVFSLVGIASFGNFGQSFTAQATAVGTDDYMRNAGGGFGLPSGTAWGTLATEGFGAAAGTQWGIGINGSPVPEPASMAVLGLGALALLRRRRRS
jgi:hypothetical protein